MTLRSASSILSAQDYNPFGEEIRNYVTGGTNDKYKFTGKERDKESGLDYFGARYYDSEVGRWLSVDPLGSQRPGLSPYQYCQNNPLTLIDPTGMLDEQLEFDENGNYKSHHDDGKKEYTGIIKNKDGKEIKKFEFNDERDALSFINHTANGDGVVLQGLDLKAESQIPMLIRNSTNDNPNLLQIAMRSQMGGLMDYSKYYATTETRKKLSLVNGTAYNLYDLGNYMWGAAMGKMGIPVKYVVAGSQLQAVVGSRRDNPDKNISIFSADDPHDQSAIYNGYHEKWGQWTK